jgi:hypothetical protein
MRELPRNYDKLDTFCKDIWDKEVMTMAPCGGKGGKGKGKGKPKPKRK